ncbi:unnamed protein product, partial [Prorocentrum cordatum]
MISQEVMRLTGRLVETQGVNAGYAQAVRELEVETGSLLDQVSSMQARRADLLGRVAAYRAESGKLTKTVIQIRSARSCLAGRRPRQARGPGSRRAAAGDGLEREGLELREKLATHEGMLREENASWRRTPRPPRRRPRARRSWRSWAWRQ